MKITRPDRELVADLVIGGLFCLMLLGFAVWWLVEWIAWGAGR